MNQYTKEFKNQLEDCTECRVCNGTGERYEMCTCNNADHDECCEVCDYDEPEDCEYCDGLGWHPDIEEALRDFISFLGRPFKKWEKKIVREFLIKEFDMLNRSSLTLCELIEKLELNS